MMQRLIHIPVAILPCAGVADIVFTTLFDPLEILYRANP